MPGERMAAEMGEQPEVLGRLLERRPGLVEELRERLAGHAGIALVARGSSDNAAIFGRYLLEAATGRPVSLVAPSLLTFYRVPLDFRDHLAVVVSQSGETPEMVEVLEALRERGATALAVTNHPESSLGRAADMVVGLEAGEERAVPATKTFTAQLAAFAFLAEALGEPPWGPEAWEAVPETVAAVLEDEEPARRVAEGVGEAPGAVCVARGFLFPVALEAALKLKETSRILAHGYSAADLRHGPIAVIEEEFPVLGWVVPGPVFSDMLALLDLVRRRGARVFTVGEADRAELPFPAGLPEPLTAFPATVRAQQVALYLALARGIDPDQPPGLSKVTG